MKKISITSFVIVLFLIFSPSIVLAASPTPAQVSECQKLKDQIAQYSQGSAGGLKGGSAIALPAYCNTGEVYAKAVYWLYYLVGIGGVLSLIYGGYVYMTAGGSDAQTKKGKTILIYTILGIVLALLATTLVTVIINLVVDSKPI